VDARSDIWSMGVILWEAISADILFPGETIGEVFSAILEQPARPLRELRPEVPERLEQIVARCLERDRDKRYPTARELSDELLELASDRTRITMTRPLRAPVVLARTTATVPEGAETLSGDAPLSATAAWTGKPETPKRGGLVAGAALSFVAAIGAIAWFAMRSPAVAEQPATGGRNPVQDLGPQRSSDAAKPAELATVTPTVSLEPTVAPMASASSAPLATPKPGPKATAAPRPTTNAKAKANLPDPLRGRD
jgi:serine/threonine-protein kinase